MKTKYITQFCSKIIVVVLLLSFFPSRTHAISDIVESSEALFIQPIEEAFSYLKTQQNEDGGFRWFDDTSNVPTTIRVILAVSASGFAQEMMSTDQKTPFDFLNAAGTDWIFQVDEEEPGVNTARAGQLLTAVAAANQNPFRFGNNDINLVTLLQAQFQADLGIFGTATPENVTDQVWAMLGLAAANAAVPEDAVNWLVNAQFSDGSWNDGYGSFLDTTPLAIMALTAAGYSQLGLPAITSAVQFLLAAQQSDGGWQTKWDSSTNPNATGMIIQSLIAATANQPGLYAVEIADARSALVDIQQETGMIGADFGNAYSTAEALLGFAKQPLYNLGTLRRVSQAFDFILSAQAPDGGWGTAGQTIDVILALKAAGWDPLSVQKNGNSPINFLANNLADYIESGPDAIGKSILGLVAADKNPLNVNNIDLSSELMDTYDPDARAFGNPENTWHQALALLGLSAAGQDIPHQAVETLVELQQTDGGWEYLPGFGTFADHTALALQALIASGMTLDDEPVLNSINFLLMRQLPNGGWGNASETAYAMMGLTSLGYSYNDLLTNNVQTPLENLLTYQDPSGGFFYSSDFPEPNLISTTAAAIAILNSSYIIDSISQEDWSYAGLVVDPGEDDVQEVCVPFSSPTLSGFDLLDKSGLPYVVQDGFINSIIEVSNPSGGTMYWAYWRWNGREWQFHNMGAADSVVYPGSIEAWVFSSWEVFPSPPPDHIPNLNLTCNQSVLKDFSDQPFLNFYDITPVVTIEFDQTQVVEPELDEVIEVTEDVLEPTTVEPIEVLEEIQETTTIATTQTADESPRATLPLIIIGTAGTLVLITILVLLLKRK